MQKTVIPCYPEHLDRGKPIPSFTYDSPGTDIHDDAVCIEPLSNGDTIIHFSVPDTNSFFRAQESDPFLQKNIHDVLSLRKDGLYPALTFSFRLSADGHLAKEPAPHLSVVDIKHNYIETGTHSAVSEIQAEQLKAFANAVARLGIAMNKKQKIASPADALPVLVDIVRTYAADYCAKHDIPVVLDVGTGGNKARQMLLDIPDYKNLAISQHAVPHKMHLTSPMQLLSNLYGVTNLCAYLGGQRQAMFGIIYPYSEEEVRTVAHKNVRRIHVQDRSWPPQDSFQTYGLSDVLKDLEALAPGEPIELSDRGGRGERELKRRLAKEALSQYIINLSEPAQDLYTREKENKWVVSKEMAKQRGKDGRLQYTCHFLLIDEHSRRYEGAFSATTAHFAERNASINVLLDYYFLNLADAATMPAETADHLRQASTFLRARKQHPTRKAFKEASDSFGNGDSVDPETKKLFFRVKECFERAFPEKDEKIYLGKM